jgi:hypothetical protein
MSTEAPVAPTRPAAPINPTAQPRPTPPANVKAPTTRRPTSSDIPDISKAPKSMEVVPAVLKEGLRKIYDAGANPPQDLVQPPKADPAAIIPPASAEPDKKEPASEPPKAEVPPAKEPEPSPSPEEVDRFSDIGPPDGLSKEGEKGWKALKTKANSDLKAAEQKLADAEAHLETLKKATPVETGEVEKLKADYKAMKERMAIIDLPSTPEYRDQFTKPKEAALTEAKEVLNYTGKEQTDLKEILGLPQKDFTAKVAELTKDMNVVDANIVINGLRTAYKIGGEERAALATAGELKAGLEAKYAAQNKQAFEETYAALDVDNLMKPFDIPDGTSAEDRKVIERANAELVKVRARAEANAFGRLTPKSAADMALKAALFEQHVAVRQPLFQKGVAALQAKLAKAEGELAAIKAAKGTGSFTAPSAPSTKTEGTWEEKKPSLLDQAFPGRAKLAGR